MPSGCWRVSWVSSPGQPGQYLCPNSWSRNARNIMQPILAVDDFKMFKAMMVQKNIELQLQAIQIIQERNGVLPDCLKKGTDLISDLEKQERRLIAEALRLSKEEYEQEQLRRKAKEGVPKLSEHFEKEEANASERTSIHKGDSMKIHDVKNQPMTTQETPFKLHSSKIKDISNMEAAEAWLEQARKEAGITGSISNLSQAEKGQLQQRAEYLKKRREELLAKKVQSKKTTKFRKHEEKHLFQTANDRRRKEKLA
ncbi:hypothetical protein GDO86_009247 [Hymenochirus boettgeri]|uniref:Cilia- and flagella-associated protein 36 n=1 Tax=Hymenochirus boettgeri TaxID=247094 RepID=A0A8T2JN06_9PIPI|nr:hypothetical protein GDO86_009247 [Hymenochirus boettgeri]